MGTAVILDADGTPCFTIPKNFETRNGLPFQGLSISELPDGMRDGLPPRVWSIRTTDYDAPPKLMPANCIKYREALDGTTQRILKPLELYKVYSVFLKAKHRGSSMIGYTGEFCIKPAESGRTLVQVIPQDARREEEGFGGCVK